MPALGRPLARDAVFLKLSGMARIAASLTLLLTLLSLPPRFLDDLII